PDRDQQRGGAHSKCDQQEYSSQKRYGGYHRRADDLVDLRIDPLLDLHLGQLQAQFDPRGQLTDQAFSMLGDSLDTIPPGRKLTLDSFIGEFRDPISSRTDNPGLLHLLRPSN